MTEKTSQSIPIRRSFRLGAWEITLLGLGVWQAIGVFGLFDSIALPAGPENGLAYVIYALLMVPSLLTSSNLEAGFPQGLEATGYWNHWNVHP